MKVIRKIFLTSVLTCVSLTISAQTWTQTSAPITNWQSIALSADGTKMVAAAGDYFGVGPIYLSTNSGVSWMQSSAPITNWLHVCSSADGSKLVGVGRRIFYSTNSGLNWYVASAPIPVEYWSSVASSADGTRLAAGVVGGSAPSARGIYLSTNSGATWYPGGVNGSDVALSADGLKLAAVVYNTFTPLFVTLSTNAGITWQSNYVSLSQPWWPLASSADGVKLAAAVGGPFVSRIGSIHTSTNSGMTWTTNASLGLPTANWIAIDSSADGSRLVAAVRNGGIYTSVDSGATWVSNTVPPADWNAVTISADGYKLAAVAFGGGIWTAQTQVSPSMSIKTATSNVVISWLKPSTDFVLQQNTNLTTTNWTTVTNAPVFNFTNLNDQVTLPKSATNNFYRLKTP